MNSGACVGMACAQLRVCTLMSKEAEGGSLVARSIIFYLILLGSGLSLTLELDWNSGSPIDPPASVLCSTGVILYHMQLFCVGSGDSNFMFDGKHSYPLKRLPRP